MAIADRLLFWTLLLVVPSSIAFLGCLAVGFVPIYVSLLIVPLLVAWGLVCIVFLLMSVVVLVVASLLAIVFLFGCLFDDRRAIVARILTAAMPLAIVGMGWAIVAHFVGWPYVIGGLGALAMITGVTGALLPSRPVTVCACSAHFRQLPETIWQAITDYEQFPTWR